MSLRRLGKVLPWVAFAVVVAFALVVGSHRPSGPAPLSARVRSIAEGVRCPTCQGETVADSQVYAARAIRADIAQRLKARQSPGEIRAYLVSRYGTGILESPPVHGLTALVWVLPVVVIPAAGVVLVVGLRRSRSRRAADSVLSDEDRALVAAALETRSSPPVALHREAPESQRADRDEGSPTCAPVGDEPDSQPHGSVAPGATTAQVRGLHAAEPTPEAGLP